jgi:hypothetical protein
LKDEEIRCNKCGELWVTPEALGTGVARSMERNEPIKQLGEAIVDINSYSEKHELDLIRNWDRGWEYLFDYIKDRWRYADSGYWEEPEPRMYKISTGRSNGNEEIVGAMKQHRIFWLVCWYSSKRGGHYEFRVPALKVEF